MEFIRVASVSELPQGVMKKVTIVGREVVIANLNGSFHALNNTCPHAGGSLANGKLNGNIVTCPKHGAQFDLMTGEAVGSAAILFVKIKPGNAVCYPVKVDGTDVLVGIE